MGDSKVRASSVEEALARSRMNVGQVLFFVFGGVAPATVAAGILPAAYGVTGRTEIPAALIVVAAVFGVFAVGYITMSTRVDNSGGFYSLLPAGLGGWVAVPAAAVALVAYLMLQFGLFGGLGAAAAANTTTWFGLSVPWWMYGCLAAAVVGVLGPRRITITGNLLIALGVAEILIVAVLSIQGLRHPAGGAISYETLSIGSLLPALFVAGALWSSAVLCFVGVETSPIFSEGARHRSRAMAVSMIAVLLVGVVLYVGASWAMAVRYGLGEDGIGKVGLELGPEALFTIGGDGVLATVARVLYMSSLFAAMLAFHNAAARYLLNLGRNGQLPAAYGAINRHGSCTAASVTVTVLTLMVIGLSAFVGLDPVTQVLFWFGTNGGFGVLILITTASLSVIVYFARHRAQHRDVGVWRAFVFPAVAFVLLLFMLAQVVDNYPLLLGITDPNALAPKVLPGLYLAAAVIGLIWAAVRPAAGTAPSIESNEGRPVVVGVVEPAEVPQPRRPHRDDSVSARRTGRGYR